MQQTKIVELAEFGQSIWLDYISRSLIEQGGLKEMISLGIRGVTSNPTIFDKAIGSSNDYDAKIAELARSGKSTFEIYDELTTRDVQDACDLFLPVYETTRGLDGYVSLEVNPKFAFDVRKTIEDCNRLHRRVKRPNVMFKIPSTDEGFAAIEELTAQGINVNITLIFSVQQYINTTQAYLQGIKRFLQNGGDVRRVRSVASVFVSRIDTVCDKLLDEKNISCGIGKYKQDTTAKIAKSHRRRRFSCLKGKAAVANCQLIYAKFRQIFSSGEFRKLSQQGVNVQRALWGSTSTKNPVYSDIKYVTELIGKDTVNTVPQNTIEAFLDHGEVKEALSANVRKAQKVIAQLEDAGIDINSVCTKLLRDGVSAFEKSFDALLQAIEDKSKQLMSSVGQR